MTSFHSRREAIEFYQKEYPNIPCSFIELAIDYDILEQQRITDDIIAMERKETERRVGSDAVMRSGKMKDRLKKKLEDKNNIVIEKGEWKHIELS